jgi:hypothetical protein
MNKIGEGKWQPAKALGPPAPSSGRKNLASSSRRRLNRSAPIVTRIVQLGVSVAASGDIRDQPKVADAVSELL